MKIKLTNVMVDDQDKALKWPPRKSRQTCSSRSSPTRPCRQGVSRGDVFPGHSLAVFEVDDIEKEYVRPKALGVVFTRQPTRSGPVTLAAFSDTCGNLIQIYQPLQ